MALRAHLTRTLLVFSNEIEEISDDDLGSHVVRLPPIQIRLEECIPGPKRYYIYQQAASQLSQSSPMEAQASGALAHHRRAWEHCGPGASPTIFLPEPDVVLMAARAEPGDDLLHFTARPPK